MLNATQTANAEAALVYPSRNLPRDERVAAVQAYNAELATIVDQFTEYLANTYLAGFNQKVKDAVWSKVREDGGGYQTMEIHYEEIADILNLV